MADPYKLRIKIGSAEFEAEGAEEVVKEQFAAFMAAVDQRSAGGAGESDCGDGVAARGQSFEGRLGQLFIAEKSIVRLRSKPSGDKATYDALILLLLGFRELLSQTDTLGTHLLRAAGLSGVAVKKTGRVLKDSEHVRKGGLRKGTRYGLTNLGVAYARQVVDRVLQSGA